MSILPRTRSVRPTAITLALTGALAATACKGQEQAQKPVETPPPAAPVEAAKPVEKPALKLDRVKRTDFNRIAAELFLPLFWVEDKNQDGMPSADEVTSFWGLVPAAETPAWSSNGQPSPAFLEAYEKIAKVAAEGHTLSGLAADEAKRRTAVLKELSQGRPTVVRSSFESASAEDKAIVKNVLEAAETIERIFSKQRGSEGMVAQIAADDTASKMLFYRNQAPWCVAPETEKDPDCNALASKPAKISGLYPANIQSDKKFCETLAARKDADKLFHQFSVVREQGGKLVAVPYNVAYKAEMESVSKSLKAAADAITSPGEAAFKAYLEAASKSFLTNDWLPADEAWSKMNVHNSKWYLRIAPDEVYYEPCSRKAGFHVSFARINQASVEWQTKLDPIKNDMENALAEMAGKPYKARKVSFHLPDFIDIIVNAGDSRDEHGATIGQSLPNWGPVANEGRGRTVAMTNFYNDADSIAALRGQTESLFCPASMATYSDDWGPQLMATVLHEAAHNLGPAHEYKVKGKTNEQAFGGPMASMLEELKAQTSADFFTDWLLEKKLVSKEDAEKSHTRNVTWAFGHISRGVYQDGKPRPYSMLAAIQFNFLVREGAITWHPDEIAANQKDTGCFNLHLDKFPDAYKKLMKVVAGIKGSNDTKGAAQLVKDYVDQPGDTQAHLKVIAERWLRAPKASFIYSVGL